MANKRMFANSVIGSDSFMDLPLYAQAVYFHLAMRADDDGFITNPKRIMRQLQNDIDTIEAISKAVDMLIDAGFLYRFDSGVCLIMHWQIHNTIQKDRYTASICKEKELVQCTVNDKGKKIGAYKIKSLITPNCNQFNQYEDFSPVPDF